MLLTPCICVYMTDWPDPRGSAVMNCSPCGVSPQETQYSPDCPASSQYQPASHAAAMAASPPVIGVGASSTSDATAIGSHGPREGSSSLWRTTMVTSSRYFDVEERTLTPSTAQSARSCHPCLRDITHVSGARQNKPGGDQDNSGTGTFSIAPTTAVPWSFEDKADIVFGFTAARTMNANDLHQPVEDGRALPRTCERQLFAHSVHVFRVAGFDSPLQHARGL